MKKCVILMLETLNDTTTSRRHQILNDSPRLVDFKIEYCYASDVIATSDSTNYAEKEELLFTSNALIEYMEEAIARYNPEVILVHTGSVYMANPVAFTRCFQYLKAKFGHIGTNYQKRADFVVDEGAFNITGQARMASELIFERILGLGA